MVTPTASAEDETPVLRVDDAARVGIVADLDAAHFVRQRLARVVNLQRLRRRATSRVVGPRRLLRRIRDGEGESEVRVGPSRADS